MTNYSKRKNRLSKDLSGVLLLVFLAIVMIGFLIQAREQNEDFSVPSDVTSSEPAQINLIDDTSGGEDAIAIEPQITVVGGDGVLDYDWDENDWVQVADIASIPAFNGEDAWYVLNDNEPYFTDEELHPENVVSYLVLSEKDYTGRVGPAIAMVGQDLMPAYGEKRGEIGSVYPTGWNQKSYDFVDGKWIYNRCHIVGWQLCGLNAEPRNLMTGTRYFNVDGMLPFENMVADYVHETSNHVLYRVTPIFENDNSLAYGAVMEGYSVEDNGESVCFCVYCYNSQPGVVIDYITGKNELDVSSSYAKAA